MCVIIIISSVQSGLFNICFVIYRSHIRVGAPIRKQNPSAVFASLRADGRFLQRPNTRPLPRHQAIHSYQRQPGCFLHHKHRHQGQRHSILHAAISSSVPSREHKRDVQRLLLRVQSLSSNDHQRSDPFRRHPQADSAVVIQKPGRDPVALPGLQHRRRNTERDGRVASRRSREE